MFLQKSLSTAELPSVQPPKKPVKHLGHDCTHNFVLFPNLIKEMAEIKRNKKMTERKFEELEMKLLNISGQSNVSYNNNENFQLLLEILKNCISNLEKELIERMRS